MSLTTEQLDRVRKFCGESGCELLTENNVCSLPAEREGQLSQQLRYIERGRCGWARKDGWKGYVSDGNFTPEISLSVRS